MKKNISNTCESEKQNYFFKNTNFNVHWAEQKVVHNEWTFRWNDDLYQIQNHRIYLILEGSALVTLRNEREETIPLLANHLYFFPPFTIDKTECPEFCNQAFVHFSTDNLYLNAIGFMPDRFCVPITSAAERDNLVYLRDTIEKNYKNIGSQESMLRIDGCLRILLSYFFHGFNEWDLDFFRFYDVFNYINDNIQNKITVHDLADIKNLNTVYFSNLFTKYFGVSPKSYLINRRIILAQKLLLQTEMNVKEVCYSVGFQTESYFIRKFTEMIGLTPMQYRKRVRISETPSASFIDGAPDLKNI